MLEGNLITSTVRLSEPDPEGKREDSFSEKVRIVTDQPTNGGDLRIDIP